MAVGTRRVGARLAVGVAGLMLFAAGVWVTLLALLFGAVSFQTPDPDRPSGDPCCGYPDTWTEVAIGGIYTAATAIAAIGFLAAGVVCLVTAVTGRVPDRVRRSTFLRRGAVVTLACAVAVPLSWVVWP